MIDRFQKYGISIFFLNFNYRCYGSFSAHAEGNTFLRKKQYCLSEEENLEISKVIILNKIENQIALLKKIREKSPEIKNGIIYMKNIAGKIETTVERESLLGYEGSVAKQFFALYFSEMNWHGRKPRTKYDIPNTLLDRGYTTLFNVVESLLRIYGFDIYCGIYHQFFYQRKSLVCDLVEPFRCIIDQALRKAYNLGQIDESDFIIAGNRYDLPYKNGGKYSRIFLEALMERKEDIFLYCQKYYRNFLKGTERVLPVFEI